MFGVAIGGASLMNILLPHAFNSHSDTMVVLVQVVQGLVQVLVFVLLKHCSFYKYSSGKKTSSNRQNSYLNFTKSFSIFFSKG
jgi:hypothetical protein